jgi:hypothetical protein
MWKDKTITAIRIDPTMMKDVDFEIDYILGKLAPDPVYAQYSGLIVYPAQVGANEPVTVSVNVKNTGDLAGDCTVDLIVNGATEESKKVTLEGGAQIEVSFTVTKATVGIYNLSVGSLKGTFVIFTSLKPAAINVKSLQISKVSVKPGEEVTVNATLENAGELSGNYTLVFNLDGVEKDSYNIALEGGKTLFKTVKFSSSVEGTHTVTVGGESVRFVVEKAQVAQTGIDGYPYESVLIGLMLVVLILIVYRKSQNTF